MKLRYLAIFVTVTAQHRSGCPRKLLIPHRGRSPKLN